MEDLEIAQNPKQKELEAAYELPAEPWQAVSKGTVIISVNWWAILGWLLLVDSQKKYNIHNRHCMYTYNIYYIVNIRIQYNEVLPEGSLKSKVRYPDSINEGLPARYFSGRV